ncbi:phosphoesterase-domain-containing protein [Penicillium sp. IBT 18751x]|nr:phosphoesterase-domain-containing protein [Penicillium sp. IBT 18751x]
MGTNDDTFYTHYSSIASVSANWGLPSLGRWDCGANLFEIVANKTGYVNYEVDTTNLLLNETYPGPAAIGWIGKYSPVWPIPITDAKCSAGYGVLDFVKSQYGSLSPTYNYTSPYPIDARNDYNTKVTAVRTPGTTSTNSTTGMASGQTNIVFNAGIAVTAHSSAIITAVLGSLVFCLI